MTTDVSLELKTRANRGEDHAARAKARLAEIRSNLPDGSEDRDKYWAPEPPAGWDYQWKTRTIYNQEDPSYQVELIRNGWEPVPLDRHPEMMPRGWSGKTIEIGGLVLMERPKVLTDEARLRENRAAFEAVRAKEQQLSSTRDGDLGKRQVLGFSKTREAIQIPDE
jgi:hypothetical protein